MDHASNANGMDHVDTNGTLGSIRVALPNAKLRVRALTLAQERKLTDYLDELFLQLTRNYKKRSEESSTLRNLSNYLEELRHILSLILQIPPIDPSTSLRTAYLLHLTGDALGSIPGYNLTDSNNMAETSSTIEANERTESSAQTTLRDLLDFLDDLDQAWLAVLQGKVWDPSSAEGVDLSVALDSIIAINGPSSTASQSPTDIKTTAPSQTEVTRLRSLLFSGESALEEWLGNEQLVPANGGADDDLPGLLEKLGLLDEFDELFTRTLDFLGGFGGVSVQSEGLGNEITMT